MSLTKAPSTPPGTFLNYPLSLDLDNLNADIAVLGIPYGLPYRSDEMANDQSLAPDAIRQLSHHPSYSRTHYDWDLGGPLLDNRDVKVVDCGNVTTDLSDLQEHYRRAEQAARKIFDAGATLVSIGGDHGIPIPVMRALERDETITLVHVDAHLDWRHNVNGVTEGYSSPSCRSESGGSAVPARPKSPMPAATVQTSSRLTRCMISAWKKYWIEYLTVDRTT